MSQKPVTQRAAAEKVVKEIRRATRKQHSAEEMSTAAEKPATGRRKSLPPRGSRTDAGTGRALARALAE